MFVSRYTYRLTVFVQKRTHLCLGTIGTKQRFGDVQKGTFASLGDPMEQKKALLTCGPCKAIAERPLQENDQFCIALHHLLEKSHPLRTADVRIVGDGQALREHIVLPMRVKIAR